MADFVSIGTPSTPPVGPVSDVAVEPLPYTRMPIHDWARRLGLNPVHFSGATVPGLFPQEECDDVWTRYAWQNSSRLSHIDVALAIVKAEELIEDHLGYHVAPAWRRDGYQYPRYKKLHATNAVDMTGRRPSIQMNRGHILGVGVQKQEFLGTETVAYQDLDNDGFAEVAYLNLSTTVDPREIALFPPGFGYHPSFQIRHPRYFRVSGSTISFVIDFWLMIKPQLLTGMPGVFRQLIDLTQGGSLETQVDVYRIYNDETDTAAVTYYWEPTPADEARGVTQATTAGGLGIVRDPQAGLVAPIFPNTYSYSPDKVEISYYSGARSHEWDEGRSLNPLDRQFADAVFYLATARLARDLCGCHAAQALSEDLRTDMALVSPAGNFLAVADKIQENPFGTRRGEWLAYQEIKLAHKHIEVAIV